MNFQDMQMRYKNNFHMRSSTPEIRPKYSITSPVNEEMFAYHTPLNTRPSYPKVSTPLHNYQRPQDIFLNRETGFVMKPKAITPPEVSYHSYLPTLRSNTPDGRYCPRGEQEVPYYPNNVSQPRQIPQYRNAISPYSRSHSPDLFPTAEQRKIAMLMNQLQEEKREKEELKRTIELQKTCMETLYIENIQAKNLLEQETEENSWLKTYLAKNRRELDELRSKQLVSRHAAFENELGTVRSSLQQSPVIRGYDCRVEEMQKKLWEKDQELAVMRKACEDERKQKQNFLGYYEDALHLLQNN